jgi:hypothetical protein
MTLMGVANEGAPGETWGYRPLPLSVGAVKRGNQSLEFGPAASPASPEPQLAFTRYTNATGWQVYETPVDENGDPYRGPALNRLSVRTTPHGGGLALGRDNSRPSNAQVVALARDPGGRFKALPAPPEDVLLPGEALGDDRGLGTVADAAVEEGGKTGAFFAAQGAAAPDGVVHWDGEGWTREPVVIPDGSESTFRIVAIAASGADNVWALARTDESLGRGIVLLERQDGQDGKEWKERPLGSTPFADAETPGQGIAALGPLGGASQPLTVTGDGVWVDGTLTAGGTRRDFTLFFDPDSGAGAVTGSWCDASVCAHPLGASLARVTGYRSFAWGGDGFGTRVITNALDAGAGEDTNRGTYLRLDGDSFRRMPGAGGNFRPSGAFCSPTEGWLEGPVQITEAAPPKRLRSWPVALRAPLNDVAPAPGLQVGAVGAQAIAAGLDGAVARYTPGKGWEREFLLTSSGAVNKAALRGVAWPEPNRAHAVGDLGAMWQWNADNKLWEADPGAPVGFEGNLMDVAFQPGNPDRGYAVGKTGVLLAYGKSWEQQRLPAGYGGRDLTQVAFAGGQALVAAGGGLLVNDGGGWREDAGVKALLDKVRRGNPLIYSVAGLPNGGAVAAGRDFVLERDSAGGPWRFSDQPLPGSTVIAVAAFRAGGKTRAVASVVPRLTYPAPDALPPTDPNTPPPIIPPFGLPGDGYVLRETGEGWTDETRTAFAGSAGSDRPIKTDPILSFALDESGTGWAVGGWSGDADSAGRGSSARNAAGRANRTRVRTAGIYRYGDVATNPPTASAARTPTNPGPVRFAVGGHAQCETACSDLRAQQIGPDSTVVAALARASALAGGSGPRAFLYTGSRQKSSLPSAEAARYAELLASSPSLPVFPALAAADAGGGAAAFKGAFSSFPAPFGGGSAPAGISTADIPGASASGTRTHYAFDSGGAGGTVRVIVIDNSGGSLAASDGHQNPAEAQRPWLIAVLADAKAKGIPTIVMGSRDLNPRFLPKLNSASDGDDIARVLLNGGASAYVYDRPEENRATRIPAGSATTIPSFGTGTLGYRSPIVAGVNTGSPDSLFGDSGYLLLEVDASKRDGGTNRAPVKVRLQPVLEALSLEAVDGTFLRRSRPTLFRGLGRRPVGGDRWGRVAAGDGNPNPPGGDPYTQFPPDQCVIAGCSARVTPDYRFTSDDPDIADFVRQDPNSTNLRKPVQDSKGKVVTDAASGLLCPFNAGTTTVRISAGGFSYAQPITVQQGSVQQPCGTRPLRPDRFKRPAAPSTSPPPPPPPPVAPNPPLNFTPPALQPGPLPVLLPAAVVAPVALLPPVPIPTVEASALAAVAPPPPPPAVRPLPPGGVAARVYQVEKEEEEEAAIEESQAFSRYHPDDGGGIPPWILGFVLLAAVAGATTVRGRPGRREQRQPAPVRAQTGTRRR